MRAKLKKLLNRLLRRFRLVIVDESTLEKKLNVSLNALNIIFAFSGVLILGITIGVIILSLGPTKKMGLSSKNEKLETLTANREFKQIVENMKANELMIAEVRKILNNDFDTPHDTSLIALNNSDISQNDLVPNSADTILRKEIELESPKGTFEKKDILNVQTLYSPVSGKLIQTYKPPKFSSWIFDAPNAPVYAVDNARVLYSGCTDENGCSILLAHEGRVISVYRNLGRVSVGHGEVIHKKSEIGTTKIPSIKTEDRDKAFMNFEIWEDGFHADPALFIDLESNED